VQAVGIGLVLVALVRELRKPRAERTWNGKVVGLVPYDVRIPTVERLRARMWAPDDAHVVMPQVFGMGWTLAFGRLLALVRGKAGPRRK
jgi:hypothetical protein